MQQQREGGECVIRGIFFLWLCHGHLPSIRADNLPPERVEVLNKPLWSCSVPHVSTKLAVKPSTDTVPTGCGICQTTAKGCTRHLLR